MFVITYDLKTFCVIMPTAKRGKILCLARGGPDPDPHHCLDACLCMLSETTLLEVNLANISLGVFFRVIACSLPFFL